FVEKPKEEKAREYLASGDYYWNSGIFVWKAAAVLGELRRHKPQLYDAVGRIADAWPTPRRAEVLARGDPGREKGGIDYAVMQNAAEVLGVEAPYRWDDVGSWLALERMQPQDADGNTVLATYAGLDTKRCVVVAEPGKLVTTLGVEGLLIVQ